MAGFLIESPTWRLQFRARTQDDLVTIVEDVADDARLGCPVDTGEMLESIHTSFAPGVGVVWVGTDHWAPTEYGSVDHDITPKGPGYPLAFFWEREGHMAFFYRVHHPGTPAQPFMRPALWKRRVPR